MKRIDVFNGITSYLAFLQTSVALRNHLNLQDVNVHAEVFFKEFLNLAFGYSLENINIVERNAHAIDLADKGGRFAIQVTSTSDVAKIKHTHKGFLKRKLEKDYDRLIILIIGNKKKYREKILGQGTAIEISCDDDVWGMSDLLMKLGDLGVEKQEKCRDFLEDNLSMIVPREANEVLTLVRLIEVLSQANEETPDEENREDPDPEGKINDRFANHAGFLRKQYTELHEIYGQALAEVKNQSELSHGQMRKLQVYLMNWSDRELNSSGGDPKAAMEVLVSDIIRKMGGRDAGYDESAIRYYLIDRLIACNVFPNKVLRHA